MADFIRGCIDGDGSVSCNKDKRCNHYAIRCHFCGASKAFMLAYNKLVKSKGVEYTIYTKLPSSKPHFIRGEPIYQKHPLYETLLTAKNAIKFLRWVYYPGNPLAMPRKAAIAHTITTTEW